MSRDDRRIKKWRSAGTLGELYLKEMAEQGLLLEDMTHLKYIFREDEPQHLRYRIEELEHAPTRWAVTGCSACLTSPMACCGLA